MVSDVQRAKFRQYFEVSDTDGDGRITKEDYHSAAEKIIAVLRLDPASPPAQTLTASYARAWNALVSDLDYEDAVTADDWIAHYSRLVLDDKQLDAFVTGRAEAILQLFDADRDEHISKAEWTLFFSTIGHPERHYEVGFQKLDRNRDGHLTKDEIKTAAWEFFASDDPEAPGNWLFGDYTPHLRS